MFCFFKEFFNLQKFIWISQHPISVGCIGVKKKKMIFYMVLESVRPEFDFLLSYL